MAATKEFFGLHNITFKWVLENYGEDALRDYWENMTKSCFSDIIEKFENGSIQDIKDYLEINLIRDHAEYTTKAENDRLIIDMKRCPALGYFLSSPNEYDRPAENYCAHCSVHLNGLLKKSKYHCTVKDIDNEGKCTWDISEKEKKNV